MAGRKGRGRPFIPRRRKGSGTVRKRNNEQIKQVLIYMPRTMATWYTNKSVDLLRRAGLPDRNGIGNRNWLIIEALRLFMVNYKANRIKPELETADVVEAEEDMQEDTDTTEEEAFDEERDSDA
jgi:hypothetical protein